MQHSNLAHLNFGEFGIFKKSSGIFHISANTSPNLANFTLDCCKISFKFVSLKRCNGRDSKSANEFAATLRKRARRVRALFEARRERTVILLVQTLVLSPPLFLARFSVFPFGRAISVFSECPFKRFRKKTQEVTDQK